MKEYDAECPVCGAINHGVFLEETDGWMECERCGAVAKSLNAVKLVAIPILTPEQCRQLAARNA